jgi:tryptophan synthase alpha chain
MNVHNGLDDLFATTRAAGRAALIPYLTAGSPDPQQYVDIAVAILDAGADALEIGVPFSDPLLDGPAIQRSQQRALEAGVTPQDCMQFAREISDRTGKPLLFFGAYNPIVAFGVPEFCRAAAASGVSGLIVPDLPLEESGELRAAAADVGMHIIQLVAPTSRDERVAAVTQVASGFVYCISVSGVTGARSGVADLARPLVARLKQHTRVPIAVGFGIASPEDARAVAQFADGVVVGSALVSRVAEADGNALSAAVEFVSSLRDALEVTDTSTAG